MLGGGAAFYTWIKQPGQRARFDRLLLKLPVVGARHAQVRDLAAGAHAGDAARRRHSAGQRARNRRRARPATATWAARWSIVAQRVREGQGFAATLLERKVVPDVAIKMIEVGESTGALQEMLNSLADFYDEEIETEVGRFVTVIEPALLIIMGIVIAAIVLALYLPLFELTSVIGAR